MNDNIHHCINAVLDEFKQVPCLRVICEEFHPVIIVLNMCDYSTGNKQNQPYGYHKCSVSSNC